MAEPEEAACMAVSPNHLCWVNGRDGNLQVMLLACLVRRAAAPGENIWRLDAVPAMNQKNGFAAMAGRGLGHSPKYMSWVSLPTAASSPASQLACRAAQRSGTVILGLNLSLLSLGEYPHWIFNSTSVQAQLSTSLPSIQQRHVLALSLYCANGGFPSACR